MKGLSVSEAIRQSHWARVCRRGNVEVVLTDGVEIGDPGDRDGQEVPSADGHVGPQRDNPELHIARVKARVAAGGHPIPEEKIRERYPNAQLNLIKLMPHVAYIKVYDNSAEAAADGTVPDPVLVLEMENGQVSSPAPDDLEALQRAPEWSKSILEAALGAGPTCDPP